MYSSGRHSSLSVIGRTVRKRSSKTPRCPPEPVRPNLLAHCKTHSARFYRYLYERLVRAYPLRNFPSGVDNDAEIYGISYKRETKTLALYILFLVNTI